MALRISTRGANTTRFSTALSCANISRVAHSACGLSPRDGLAMAPPRPRTWVRLSTYGTHNSPVNITVSDSQNNSRVIAFPLVSNSESGPGRIACYRQRPVVALRADPDVAARRILDRRQYIGADRARRDFLAVEGSEPLPPIRPPRPLVLLRALEPVRQRNVLDIVVGPELVFARRRRVYHAGDVSGSGQHVFDRAAEKLRAVQHRLRRCDVILAGRQIVDRQFHLRQVEQGVVEHHAAGG